MPKFYFDLELLMNIKSVMILLLLKTSWNAAHAAADSGEGKTPPLCLQSAVDVRAKTQPWVLGIRIRAGKRFESLQVLGRRKFPLPLELLAGLRIKLT